MAEKFRSYPIKTLTAILLMIAGILLSILALRSHAGGDLATIAGIILFQIGAIICLKIYGETWFQGV